MLRKVCPICGIEYETNRIRQIYCSKECATTGKIQKQKEMRHSVKKYQKTCIICGKEFGTNYNRQKYCSKECQTKAYLKARKERKYCEWCGKPFATERSNKRFCSPKCASLCYRSHMSEDQKQKKRDAARRHRERTKIKTERARTIESYHSERLEKLIEGDGGYNYGKNRAAEFLKTLPPIDLSI